MTRNNTKQMRGTNINSDVPTLFLYFHIFISTSTHRGCNTQSNLTLSSPEHEKRKRKGATTNRRIEPCNVLYSSGTVSCRAAPRLSLITRGTQMDAGRWVCRPR